MLDKLTLLAEQKLLTLVERVMPTLAERGLQAGLVGMLAKLAELVGISAKWGTLSGREVWSDREWLAVLLANLAGLELSVELSPSE